MGLLLSKGLDRTIIDAETNEEVTIAGSSIYIKGTDIELPNCYARIQFLANSDGRTINVTYKTYLNYSKYQEGSNIETDIFMQSFDFVISDLEVQSLDVALQYSVQKFVELGYSAEIV